jgi:hypothetical protein
MTNYELTWDDISDLQQKEEQLKQNKGLIILIELTKYCEDNNAESIRYTKLKRLSNDKLNEFTGGYQTDFGGAFDMYIKKYEEQRYLKRDKRSPRTTFIVPDITTIENLIDKKRLKNSLDRMNLVRSDDVTIYGGLKITGGLVIPDNFSKDMVRNFDSEPVDASLQNTIPLFLSPWKIYAACDKDKDFHLPEQKIQELLHIGKTIASKDRTMPFKIILEYEGIWNSIYQ